MICCGNLLGKSVSVQLRLPRSFREPSESSGLVNCTKKPMLTQTFREPSESSALVGRKKRKCLRQPSGNLPSQAPSLLCKATRRPPPYSATCRLRDAYGMLTGCLREIFTKWGCPNALVIRQLPRSFREPSESSAPLGQTQKSCFRGASANLPSQARPWVKPQKVASEELPRTFRVKRG